MTAPAPAEFSSFGSWIPTLNDAQRALARSRELLAEAEQAAAQVQAKWPQIRQLSVGLAGSEVQS